MTRTAHDDLVRGLLNSRSARSGVPAALSPTPTADAFSLTSPRPGLYTSPQFTERSESPSCYSRSQMSLDDSCSEVSDDHPTTSTYRSRFNGNADKYRSYVDPMRDSSEDERTEALSDVQESGSNDTLSDTGMLRPVESDTSVSSALSGDTTPDPRLSYLGPKTRMISKAPWEEGGEADEEAVSDTEAADTFSVFTGFKAKGRSRSKTLTQCKAEVERFLGGGWGRTSSDARPSMDSSKRSIESSVASYIQTPTSPRNGSFSDVIRGVSARTPSIFSASSATSSSAAIRPRGGSSGAGVQLNAYHLDSRGSSPVSSSPTTPNFVHPYANLELLSAGPSRDGEASPSRTNSSSTLTASTVASCYVTPSSTASSATLPEQHEQPPKKEKHRPPHITVVPLSRGGSHASSVKSPSALSVSFVPLSPTSMSATSGTQDDAVLSGMLGFPGSPAYNLISLEQAQARARERSRSITSNTPPIPISARPKEIVHKKSKPNLGPVGGGFSSTIGGGSPSPHWNPEEARARTVSAGSAPRNRPRGYTATSIASQSTTSVNIIPGSAIENIPEPKSTGQTGTPMETVPPRQLKPKRSGFLKLFGKNGTSSGNPNISSPITPVHISHNGVDLPPVPKLPAQYQTSKASSPSPSDLGARRELPPVVVSPALGRTQSLERSQSVSDDSHTSIGDHQGQSKFHQYRSNTEPPKPLEDDANVQDPSFGLKLRPVSSVFKGMPEDYLTGSPKVAKSRGSGESRNGDSSGFEDSNVLSPATPYFPQSARSYRTHVSTASTGSDAFSSSVDPRTPSSLGFPGSVPRSSTDSHRSASIIASLREQIESLRKASQQQISDLESQVQSLKAELDATKCDRCGRKSEDSIINRPRAPTGTGCRTALGSSYD